MGSAKLRTNNKLIIVLGVVLLALVLLSIAVARGISAGPIPDAQLWHRQQEEIDRLPERIQSDQMDRDSARFLGEIENLRYWAAYHRSGDKICIVAMVEQRNDRWVSAAGCNFVEQFHRHGAAVSIKDTGTGHFSSGIFIPDGYFENARDLLPEAVVLENLIVFDSRESIELTISGHGDPVVTIPPDDTQTRRLPNLELYLGLAEPLD